MHDRPRHLHALDPYIGQMGEQDPDQVKFNTPGS